MQRSIASLLALVLLGGVVQGQEPSAKDKLPPPPDGKEWKLIWHDEFEGTVLDDSKWETPPNAKRRDGWWLKSAVSLDGQGHLAIKTFKVGDRFGDGCARTRGRFERAYGYYIARIRMHSQPGHWPGFWLYNGSVCTVGDEGRDGTEIDIMEKPWLEDRVSHALHWDGYDKEHQSVVKEVDAPGVSQGFHTYSVWWTPTEYVFYVDGVETWRTSAGGVCQAPLYIKLSDEIASWLGDISKAKLPDELLVDYVRVYDLVEKQ